MRNLLVPFLSIVTAATACLALVCAVLTVGSGSSVATSSTVAKGASSTVEVVARTQGGSRM
jgi:hypothetical protein